MICLCLNGCGELTVLILLRAIWMDFLDEKNLPEEEDSEEQEIEVNVPTISEVQVIKMMHNFYETT